MLHIVDMFQVLHMVEMLQILHMVEMLQMFSLGACFEVLEFGGFETTECLYTLRGARPRRI